MRFYGQIINGELFFPQMIMFAREQYLTKLKPCTPIIEEITVHREPKTQRQLGAWWGLFCQTALTSFNDNGWDSSFLLRLDKPTGIAPSKELLKEYMYSVCPIFDDGGKRITMSGANTTQMAKFFDDCRNFASSQWGVFVPEPDGDYRSKK